MDVDLNWFDETERSEMRASLLEEVERTLTNRKMDRLSNGAIDVDVAPIQGVDR